MLWVQQPGKHELENKLAALDTKTLQELPEETLSDLITRSPSLPIDRLIFLAPHDPSVKMIGLIEVLPQQDFYPIFYRLALKNFPIRRFPELIIPFGVFQADVTVLLDQFFQKLVMGTVRILIHGFQHIRHITIVSGDFLKLRHIPCGPGSIAPDAIN